MKTLIDIYTIFDTYNVDGHSKLYFICCFLWRSTLVLLVITGDIVEDQEYEVSRIYTDFDCEEGNRCLAVWTIL